MELRPYQQKAIDAVLKARKAGVRRMVVCLPTGAGKTVIFAALASLARKPVLVLAHRDELLTQAREKLQAALGVNGVVAIEQGPNRAPDGARVVVASIRSLHEERLTRLLRARQFGLIIYDECHHATADDNKRVLRDLGAFDDDWTGTLLGVTATTQRRDGIGLGEVFEQIVYHRGLPEMIREGWMVPLRGYRIATAADLRDVQAAGDDLQVEPLAEAVDLEERNALVARSIQELARDRRTLVFCVTVRHARNLAHALNAIGVPCGMVHGEMKRDRRQAELKAFREGRVRALTNVAVLTEGFDDPEVSCIAMARPTRSPMLYAQCVGRGVRLAPGKHDCLVLDFADVSELELCTLPSLLGMPYQMDLQGEDALEAEEKWQAIIDANPGFEIDPGTITLKEIQDRAAHFDPLSRRVDPEVRAISPLDWFSLGRHGVVLHWQAKPGLVKEALIRVVGARGKRWRVEMDGKERARFSQLEEAVAAVDWEIEQIGRLTHASALVDAAWRRQPPPPGMQAWLKDVTGNRGGPKTWSEALRFEALWRVEGRSR